MSPNNYNRKLISLAVASACAGFIQPALAQESGAPGNTAETTATATSTVEPAATTPAEPVAAGEVQQVTVTGFRSSLERAINLKRASIGTRDSIVAEDIGKFPEQNIADALVRLPGVEVVKDPGTNEGQRIQMRGLGSEYTVTTFNGAAVRATSGGSIGQSTRDFNYDIFASELFGRTDVYKTPLAELEEGGVAGVVDMQTPRPFDSKKQTFRYSAAVARNTRSGLNSPRMFALYSNTWGDWGLLVGVTRSGSKNANAGFQSTGTYASTNQRLDPGSFNYTYNLTDPSANYSGVGLADLRNAILPRFFRSSTSETERDRVGFNTSLQWKSGDWDVSLDTLASQLKDKNKSNSIAFPIRDSTGANALIPRGVTVDQKNNLQGSLANVQAISGSAVSRAETEFKYVTLNAKWRATDALRFTGQLGTNRSEAWSTNASINGETGNGNFDNRHTITFNTTDDPMFPQLSSDRNLLDPNLYRVFGYSGGYRTETDKQKNIKLVAEYDYGFWNVEAKLKTGLSRAVSTKDSRQFTTTNLLNAQRLANGKLFSESTAAEKAAYAQGFMVPNDLKNVKIDNVPTDYAVISKDFIYGNLNAVAANRAAAPNFGGTFVAKETIDAFFVQSDFETKFLDRDLRANAGVRYVRTTMDVDNYRLNSSNVYNPQQAKSSYHNVLPSLSLAYDLTDDLVGRASWGKTLTRSSISLIARPFFVPGAGDLIVNANNPDLRPQQSSSLDAGLEWYFEKGGVLALSVFQKDIKDRPQSQSTFVPFSSLGLPKELWTSNIQGTVTADPNTPVELRRWANADEFKVKGLEIAYQQAYRRLPAPFNNLGSIVSYTRIDAAGFKAQYNGAVYELPIIPKSTYALTLYYEQGPLALRTSYNHKTEFANQGAPALNPLGYNRWFNERGYLDASVSYKFSDALELRLDGSNLTNERTYDFLRHFEGRYGDEHSRIENANLAGKTFTLTLRGKF
ncbi:TonB-dependent receptor [Pseudoduganella lutea]|nr:TonB-dependent receptor [Pseudoduganella lutea]